MQLLDAATRGDLPALQYLLNSRVNANCQTEDGWTPLLEAAKGKLAAVRLLLFHGADPDSASEKGYTPLMRAAGHGQMEIVRVLLGWGADPDLQDDIGQTALDMAVAGNYTETAALLRRAHRRRLADNPLREADTPPSSAPNRSQPIFITSTFRDMQSERDYLRDVVFPRLEERLQDRLIRIEPVDLRWGVEPSSTEERMRSLDILRVCVEEIHRSRPFFIALIGDRYGWRPPADQVLHAVKEAGLKEDPGSCSVTELEIRCALSDSRTRSRCLVYVREGLDYRGLVETGRMPETTAAEFSEAYRQAAQLPAEAHRLARLKTHVEPYARSYSARWNPERQRIEGLEEWGERVGEELWQALKAETNDLKRRVPDDWKLAERHAAWEFIHDECRNVEERPHLLERLVRHVRSDDKDAWGLTVVSPPGFGKSALLAALCEEVRNDGAVLLPHFAGLTLRAGSAIDMLRVWARTLAETLGARAELENAPWKRVVHTFWSLTRRVALSRKVVLVLDAAESLQGERDSGNLLWMTAHWPANVRLVISSRGPAAETLGRTKRMSRVHLNPIPPSARQKIIEETSRRYHRGLHVEARDALLAKKTPSGGEAAGNARWLRLAMDALNLIDQSDFAASEREGLAISPEDRIHRLLQSVVEALPPSLEGIYAWMLSRAGRVHDIQECRAFLGLLAASRTGLRERDLRRLVPRLLGSEWDDLGFAMMRRTFRAVVKRRGKLDAWDIVDPDFRRAVLGWLGPEGALPFHEATATYLLSLDERDPLREAELPFHLIKAGDRTRLAQYLAQSYVRLLQALESELSDMGDDRLPRAPEYLILRRDLELDLSQGLEKLRSKAVGAPMMHAGAALAQEVRRRTDGVRWVLSLLDELGVQEQWTLCEWFEGMLTDILRDKAKHDLLASLAKGLQEIRERLLRSLPDVEGEQWLIASRVRRADLDRERGGYAAALAAYQGALQAARDLHGEDPQDPVALDDLGLIQSRIGVTLQGMGDRAGAVQALEDSLRLARELRSLEDSGFARNGVAVRCLKLGDVYRGLRQFEEARRCYEETQELMQRPELLPSQSKREALLASSIEALAGIEGDTGDRRRAITLFQNAVDLRRRILSRDPASRSSRSSLGGVLCRLADLHLQLRETEQARAHYEETLRLLGEGDEQDPEDLSARFQRGDVSIGLLKSCGAVDRDELRRMAEETMREIERLRSDLPTNVDVTRHAFDGYVHIGRALEGQGAPDAAVVAFGRAIEAADEFLRADPDGSTALRNLSVAYMSRGNCLARQDKWASARPDFERCLDLTKAALANRPSDRNLIRDLVGGYWMLGMACLETGEEERVEESIRSCGRALEDYLAAGFEPDKQLQEIQRRLREIL